MQITCKSEIYHLDEVHWMPVEAILLVQVTFVETDIMTCVGTEIIYLKNLRCLLETDRVLTKFHANRTSGSQNQIFITTSQLVLD